MEGPSLILLRDETQQFIGRRVLRSSGSTRQINPTKFKGKTVHRIDSWGKHLLLTIGMQTLRIHFLMYGSYRVNDPREDRPPRLSLGFNNGSLDFYSCSIQPLLVGAAAIYDWRTDLMSHQWDANWVRRLVDDQPDALLCDLLLDQTVFSGAGNIIKNEVLWLLRQNPLSKLKTLSDAERSRLVNEMREYSFRFYEWRKTFALKKNWQIYRKKVCPLCKDPVTLAWTGQTDRISFWCPHCQPLRRAARRRRAPHANDRRAG